MTASAVRDAIDGGRASLPTGVPVEKAEEFGLEASIGDIEHLAAGHDDYVEAARRLMVAKKLADEPFSAIPGYGRSQFPGGGNSKAGASVFPRPREHRHQPAAVLKAGLIDELEIRPFSNVFRREELRQGLKPISRPIPSISCGPWRGGASAPDARLWSPYEPGNHAFSLGAGCWVETFACPSSI